MKTRTYPAGAICEAFGINSETLRGWRNRLGLRTDAAALADGWKRYTFADALRIATVVRLTRLGLVAASAVKLVNGNFDNFAAVAADVFDDLIDSSMLGVSEILPGWEPPRQKLFPSRGAFIATIADELAAPVSLFVDFAALSRSARAALSRPLRSRTEKTGGRQ